MLKKIWFDYYFERQVHYNDDKTEFWNLHEIYMNQWTTYI